MPNAAGKLESAAWGPERVERIRQSILREISPKGREAGIEISISTSHELGIDIPEASPDDYWLVFHKAHEPDHKYHQGMLLPFLEVIQACRRVFPDAVFSMAELYEMGRRACGPGGETVKEYLIAPEWDMDKEQFAEFLNVFQQQHEMFKQHNELLNTQYGQLDHRVDELKVDLREMRADIKGEIRSLAEQVGKLPTEDRVKVLLGEKMTDNARFRLTQTLIGLGVLATLVLAVVDFFKH